MRPTYIAHRRTQSAASFSRQTGVGGALDGAAFSAGMVCAPLPITSKSQHHDTLRNDLASVMHRASPRLYTPARARLSGPSDARITLTRDARCITAARKGPPRLQSADMRGRLLCYSAVMHRASPRSCTNMFQTASDCDGERTSTPYEADRPPTDAAWRFAAEKSRPGRPTASQTATRQSVRRRCAR